MESTPIITVWERDPLLPYHEAASIVYGRSGSRPYTERGIFSRKQLMPFPLL
jgi:hypothetical protein